MAKDPKPIAIGRAMTWNEVAASIQAKHEQALLTHKTNGGMCQKCSKEKAEYPAGINPFFCKTCNAETEEILKQLRGPGFAEVRLP